MKIVTNLLETAENKPSVWALWNWNSQLTEEHIIQQFSQIKDAGFSGIIIRPSYTMAPNYLSEEFSIFFLQLLSLGEKYKMPIMLGDDFSAHPSSAFSQTLKIQKNYRASRLTLVETHSLSVGEEFSFSPLPNRQEYLLVARKTSQNKIELEETELLFDGKKATATKWRAPKGSWQVIRFAVVDAKTDSGELIPNFFSMRCAQSYVNTILEPICEMQGKKLSSSFKGIYCEMPPIVPSKSGIPWDEELFISKYRSRFKRNLITTLPAIFFPTIESEAKYRPHVLNFVQDTLVERFPSVCQKWASTKGLDYWFIGAESDVTDHISSVSAVYAPSSTYAVTGIRNDTNTALSEAAVITASTLNRDFYKRSTAVVINRNSHMKSNTLAEAKFEADSAILNGADVIVIDGFYMNQEYTFSRITPPGINFSHPDFPRLQKLVSTLKNTIAVTRHGKKFASKVALIFPSQSAIADFTISDPSIIPTITETFLKVVNELHASQIPFTIFTEQDITECKANSDGTLIHANSNQVINGIILPYSRLVSNSLFVLLEKFAIKRGTVLFINEAPQGSFDDGLGSQFLTRIEKVLSTKGKSVYATPVSGISKYFGPETTDNEYRLTSETDIENIRVHFSEFNDLSAVIIQNRSSEPVPFSLPRLELHHYYYFNPTTGEVCIVDEDNSESEKLFHFDVQPYETLTLFSIPGSADNSESLNLEKKEFQYRIRLRNDRWQFEAQSLNNFPLTRWNTRMSIDRGNGILSNYYESSFELTCPPMESYIVFADSKARFVKEISQRFKVLLNGQELTLLDERVPSAEEASSYFDSDNSLLIYSLHDYLERGTNTIRVMKNNSGPTPDPLNFPPIVSVNAPVEQTPKGWRVIPTPEENQFNWGDRGYPYLIGTGQFSHSFEVPKDSERIILDFEELSGAAEIVLNGESAGTLLWPPYRLDITDKIVEKRNELSVIVRNSLSSVSCLNGKKSGIIGDVFLEIYDESMAEAEDE